MSRLVSAEEARGIRHTPVVRGSWIYCAKCSACLTEDSPPCTIRSDEEVADLAATVIALSEERDRLRATLYREGYAPCSSAACNCGDWHK